VEYRDRRRWAAIPSVSPSTGCTRPAADWEPRPIAAGLLPARLAPAPTSPTATTASVGNIQFGYRLAKDGKHVEPDPGEQAALAEIARLRKRGGTLRGIAAALNGRALRTRRGTASRHEHIARIIKQGARQAA
jgi:hypothetical protein